MLNSKKDSIIMRGGSRTHKPKICPSVLFLLAIVLSVLRFTDSDYPLKLS